MQTDLEIKAIKKRTTDSVVNSTKVFGVAGNEVKGNSVDSEYSTATVGEADGGVSKSKKGGNSIGSLVNHLNKGFDVTSGGDVIDQKARQRQQGYVIPGQTTYSEKNVYSDADNIKVDTSLNIGQVVIY